jgi:hypothetical protein
MAGNQRREDLRAKLQERLNEPTKEPFLGHPLLPIPLRTNKARTERVSSYVELDFLKFMEEYQTRGGFRSVSEVLRRLAILGAMKEGYQFTGDGDELK